MRSSSRIFVVAHGPVVEGRAISSQLGVSKLVRIDHARMITLWMTSQQEEALSQGYFGLQSTVDALQICREPGLRYDLVGSHSMTGLSKF